LRSNASDDFTWGDLRIIRNSTNEIETSGDTSQFEIQQSNTNGDAYMTFHIASDYAVNFGLDGETNDLVVWGWSLGAAKYRILREWHTGDYIADNTIDNTEIQNGTLTYTDTNVNSIQRRITGTCAAGSSIRAIANNGTVTCETDDTGSGGLQVLVLSVMEEVDGFVHMVLQVGIMEHMDEVGIWLILLGWDHMLINQLSQVESWELMDDFK